MKGLLNNNHIGFATYRRFFRIVLALTLLASTQSRAEETAPEFFTFTFENDLFVGEDSGYTNGMGFTFGTGPFEEFNNDNLPQWLHSLTKGLYISTMKNKRRGIAHMFFQRMQTPQDLSINSLITNDIPYAGLLAWQGTMFALDDNVADHLSLYLGMVGPFTFAEESQKLIHKMVGAKKPHGWNNQLKNEPIFKVELQRTWKLYRTDGEKFQFDILGLAGAGIGNLESSTKGGFAVRWGTRLQASFATFSLDLDRQVNPLALTDDDDFYLFIGGNVGVVLNDILIDGNTFRDSHSVPLNHNQNQVSAGIVWSLGHYAFVFQVTSLSSRTELTDEREKHGALNVTFRY